jgi:chlorobactene glucosyltransferase
VIWRVLGAAWPWLALPLVTAWRVRGSRSLDDESDALPDDAPLVSVVIPARNERANIERCLRSVLASRYAPLEVIVVDDHSDDGTGDLARAIASHDPRLRVVENPALPDGWMGKQWACATGARQARGAIVCFADADTTHAPDLLPRAVAAMRSRHADLLSVAGRQELGTFWERVVQPQVFAVLASRYGGTESVNRSPRVSDKIANGQCLLVRRSTYETLGGHALVRDSVAEDLMLAQRFFAAGKTVTLVLGTEQLATRMYTSLREIVRGWRKNIFAGGREAVPGGALGRAVFPLLLISPPLMMLAPPVLLALGALGLAPASLVPWTAVATVASLLWWTLVYRAFGLSILYALTYPLGAAVLLGISVQAIVRGSRVAWKGREYVAGRSG